MLSHFSISTGSHDDVINSEPVFVTAFSDNHYLDAMTFFTQFNATLAKESTDVPSVTLYLYNLGIGKKKLQHIRKEFGHFVAIRDFPFHKYPAYVTKLREYRWKPLIIAEMLKRHKSFWWMDSSVRVWSLKHIQTYYDYLRSCYKDHDDSCKLYPLTMVSETGHSIFAATSSGMYQYLPIVEEDAQKIIMRQATAFLLFGTDKVKREIIFWWVLCALEVDCMAPSGHYLYCNKKDLDAGKYAGCHRYDQSALNILVASANNYDQQKFSGIKLDGLSIDRLQ